MSLAANTKIELRLVALALAFGWLGALSLALQRGDALVLGPMLALSVGVVAAHVWLNRVAPGRDATLLPIVTMLLAFGFIMIARVAPNFLSRQLGALAVALVGMLAVASSRDQLRWLRRFKYTWLIGALVLLAATLIFGVNPNGFGARLWLTLGGAFFQPSEILRLLMIAFLAAYFAERLEIRDKRLEIAPEPISNPTGILSLQSLIPTVAMWLIAIVLLVTQQDLGAATLLLLTFGFMLYLATGDARLPLALAVALLLVGVVGYGASARVAQRVNIWLNPWADPQGNAFQVVQSLIAVASGGVFGQGVNQGRPGYVPAVHTDFPFVMVAEELGLIGALALIACYASLCLGAWRIASRASTAYRRLLAGGIAAAFAIQVFIIIGGNLSLVPLTGVTLPFVSVGGTSLVVSCLAVGLLLRISADGDTARPSRATIAAQRATTLTAAMFAVLALTTGLWSTVGAASLTTRDDNPRRVDAELAIERGAIFDRSGVLMAESMPHAGSNNDPNYRRRYLLPDAAPAVGYYSQRYGVGGIEAFADATLRGGRTTIDDLLHRPRLGTPITLTLDARLQTTLQRALQSAVPNTVTHGAAIVLDASNGQVLALASSPAFDPNTLDATWAQLTKDPSAPLVNRATQGLYQPGALLRWMAEMGNQEIRNKSQDKTDKRSWLLALGSFDLDKPVPFELPNQAVPYPASVTVSDTLGQGSLRLTPLRVAAVAAQLAISAPITPTLLLSNTQPSRAVQPIQPIITFARIGEDRVVGWLVRGVGARIIVVAIEMRAPDEAALAGVADAAR